MKNTKWIALPLCGALLLTAPANAEAVASAGDVNRDGAVTAEDARLALRAAVGLEIYQPESPAFLAADADGDGTISAKDARLILRAAVGLPEEDTPPTPAEPDVPRTAKGYEIREIDGITYVDGVLIANKTYALPRSYAPGDLTPETYAAFKRMQADGWKKGLSLWISSGYRSWDLQYSLYHRYAAADGYAMADRYSARPGHSEHQTGLCFDLNTITQSFAYTAEGKWVAANCWRYGFILRYPQGKEAQTGYMYEPWHLRYLGEELAAKVYASGLCLEEYFGITSVYQ